MTKSKGWIVSGALGLGLVVTSVWAGQVLVPEQSEILFVGKQMGVPVEGRFQKFTVEAAIDPAVIGQSTARIVFDMNSIALPAADLTTEIKRKRWFDTAAFPVATFESKRFRALGDGRYELEGTVIIKGVSRVITVPLSLMGNSQNLTAEGQFELKRLDFNIGDGPWADTDTVADVVRVRFKLRLKPQP